MLFGEHTVGRVVRLEWYFTGVIVGKIVVKKKIKEEMLSRIQDVSSRKLQKRGISSQPLNGL